MIIKDESLIVAEACTQPPPAWFVPTGDAAADVDKLVKRLIAEGEKDGSAVAELLADIRVATRCKDLTSEKSEEETLEEIGYPERERRWRDALSPVAELGLWEIGKGGSRGPPT